LAVERRPLLPAHGKRLPVRHSEIFIQFREVPHSIFAKRGAVVQPNKLCIRLQPEENIRLLMMAKQPGLDRQGIRLREVPLDLGMANAFADVRRRIAYERLLLDLIEGDPRCSCDATKWKRNGNGSIASAPAGRKRACGPKAMPPAPGVHRQRSRLPNATARAGMNKVTWAEHADDGAVADHLAGIITRPGVTRLAVPGGSTPIPILRCLGQRDLGRAQAELSPDGRSPGPHDHPASNFGLLQRNLHDSPLRLLPLEPGDRPGRFDLVWIGMGADGHIASIFPNQAESLIDGADAQRTLPTRCRPKRRSSA
jgi:hypothetical protein